MMQQEFMKRLHKGIAALPKTRQQEIEDDIGRHFEEGLANGEQEDTLASMLGEPEVLAAEYVGQYLAEYAGQPKKTSLFKKIWKGIGLFFLDLCLGLPVAVVLLAVWLVLACGAIIAFAGVLSLLLVIINQLLPLNWLYIGNNWAVFFGSIACMSGGVLMSLAAVWFGKKLLIWAALYGRFHKRVIQGRVVKS